MLVDYHIGTLTRETQELLANSEATVLETTTPREVFLTHKFWTKAILSAKTSVSPDTKIFTFDLEHASQAIGLPIGQHLMMRVRDPATREAIIRAYTPISSHTARGKLDVLVKVYEDTPTRKGGRMTQALDSVPLGHLVDFKGPHGKFEYLGHGRCTVSGRARRTRRFVMVCGGSGITPIYTVLRAVLADSDDPTSCVVLYGNRTEEDILCKKELDAMMRANENRCRVTYVLSRPGPRWTGARGRIDGDLIGSEVGSPSSDGDEIVLVCGPKSLEGSVLSIFIGLGWQKEDMVFF